MKAGKVYKLREPRHPAFIEEHGWLWVYEGKTPLGRYMFKSVASGDIESVRYPQRVFENWGEDNDAG